MGGTHLSTAPVKDAYLYSFLILFLTSFRQHNIYHTILRSKYPTSRTFFLSSFHDTKKWGKLCLHFYLDAWILCLCAVYGLRHHHHGAAASPHPWHRQSGKIKQIKMAEEENNC